MPLIFEGKGTIKLNYKKYQQKRTELYNISKGERDSICYILFKLTNSSIRGLLLDRYYLDDVERDYKIWDNPTDPTDSTDSTESWCRKIPVALLRRILSKRKNYIEIIEGSYCNIKELLEINNELLFKDLDYLFCSFERTLYYLENIFSKGEWPFLSIIDLIKDESFWELKFKNGTKKNILPEKIQSLSIEFPIKIIKKGFLLWITIIWRVYYANKLKDILSHKIIDLIDKDEKIRLEWLEHQFQLFIDTHLNIISYLVKYNICFDSVIIRNGIIRDYYPYCFNVCTIEELPNLTGIRHTEKKKANNKNIAKVIIHIMSKLLNYRYLIRSFDQIFVRSMNKFPILTLYFKLILKCCLLGNFPRDTFKIRFVTRVRTIISFNEEDTIDWVKWVTKYPKITFFIFREMFIFNLECQGYTDKIFSENNKWIKFKKCIKDSCNNLRSKYDDSLIGENCFEDVNNILEHVIHSISVKYFGKLSKGEFEIIFLKYMNNKKIIELTKKKNAELIKQEEEQLQQEEEEDDQDEDDQDEEGEENELDCLDETNEKETNRIFKNKQILESTKLPETFNLEALHFICWCIANNKDIVYGEYEKNNKNELIALKYLKVLGITEYSFNKILIWYIKYNKDRVPDNSFLKKVKKIYNHSVEDFNLLKMFFKWIKYYRSTKIMRLPYSHLIRQLSVIRKKMGIFKYEKMDIEKVGIHYYCGECQKWATSLAQPPTSVNEFNIYSCDSYNNVSLDYFDNTLYCGNCSMVIESSDINKLENLDKEIQKLDKIIEENKEEDKDDEFEWKQDMKNLLLEKRNEFITQPTPILSLEQSNKIVSKLMPLQKIRMPGIILTIKSTSYTLCVFCCCQMELKTMKTTEKGFSCMNHIYPPNRTIITNILTTGLEENDKTKKLLSLYSKNEIVLSFYNTNTIHLLYGYEQKKCFFCPNKIGNYGTLKKVIFPKYEIKSIYLCSRHYRYSKKLFENGKKPNIKTLLNNNNKEISEMNVNKMNQLLVNPSTLVGSIDKNYENRKRKNRSSIKLKNYDSDSEVTNEMYLIDDQEERNNNHHSIVPYFETEEIDTDKKIDETGFYIEENKNKKRKYFQSDPIEEKINKMLKKTSKG